MYNGRLNLSTQVLDEIKKYYADKLFSTTIPRAVKLSEAPGFGTPINYHDKYSKACQSYVSATEEVLSRIGIVKWGRGVEENFFEKKFSPNPLQKTSNDYVWLSKCKSEIPEFLLAAPPVWFSESASNFVCLSSLKFLKMGEDLLRKSSGEKLFSKSFSPLILSLKFSQQSLRGILWC
jgi:hypothetical protein